MTETLNVCMISKFPPIEGGMSSSAYWLADAISQDERFNVTVITNSNVVEEEHAIGDCDLKIDNLDVRYIGINDQFIIPKRHYDIAGFIEVFFDVVKEKRIDVIDAQYLIPYGIVAYLINKMFKIPYIIRHGGSDVDRFFRKGVYGQLLRQVIENASIVDSTDEFIYSKSKRHISLPTYVPPPVFNTNGRSYSLKIRAAYIGKLVKLYETKGLDKIVNSFRTLKNKVDITFLSQGLGMNDFIRNVNPDYIKFNDFIPPWKMPSFYKNIDCVLYFVKNNPLPDWSNVVVEALASGVKIITDDVSFFSKFGLSENVLNSDFIQVNLDDSPENIYEALLKGLSKKSSLPHFDYSKFIVENKELYIETAKVASI